MPDFFINALIAGTLIAVIAGPLGCFVVWRRMAYFGGAIAHSALLGVALALLAGGLLLDAATSPDDPAYRVGSFLINDPWPVVLVVSLLLAGGLLALQRRHLLASDTLLGIVAHGSLAVGLLIVASMASLRIDVMSYLFGDILGIDDANVRILLLPGIAVLALLVWQWRALLAITVNAEMAAVEGIHVGRTELMFVLMLACVVALGIRVVGVLLIVSMLIIPPATARRMSNTPVYMAVMASVIGVFDVWAGLAASWYLDLPAGPAIVAVSMVLFMTVMLLPGERRSG